MFFVPRDPNVCGKRNVALVDGFFHFGNACPRPFRVDPKLENSSRQIYSPGGSENIFLLHFNVVLGRKNRSDRACTFNDRGLKGHVSSSNESVSTIHVRLNRINRKAFGEFKASTRRDHSHVFLIKI